MLAVIPASVLTSKIKKLPVADTRVCTANLILVSITILAFL